MTTLPTMAGIHYRGKVYVEEADCRANVNAALALKQQTVDVLVAALERAQPVLERLAAEGNTVAEDIRNDIRAALAKARGAA